MESFLVLPEFLMEYIFSYLRIPDLISCSLVCSEWYRIINSNRIWRRLCENSVFLKHKFQFSESSSFIDNPLIKYSEDNFYSFPSEWKSYFNRCFYIKNNWRLGRCAKLRFPYMSKVIYASKSYIVELERTQLNVRKLCKTMEIISSFHVKQKVYCIRGNDSFIAIKYEYNLSLLKMCDGKFKRVFLDEQMGRIAYRYQVVMELGVDYFVYIDVHMASILKICDLRKDVRLLHSYILEEKLKTSGNLQVVQVKVVGDIILILYMIDFRTWLVKFELGGVWDDPIPLEGRARRMYASAHYVCVKTESNDPFHNLVTAWKLCNPQLKCVAQFSAYHLTDIAFQSDDRIMFNNVGAAVVMNLFDGDTSEQNLPMSNFQIFPVWDCFIVLYDRYEISVWNWRTWKKLNTLWKRKTDEDYNLYVSENVVIAYIDYNELRYEFRNLFILSFW